MKKLCIAVAALSLAVTTASAATIDVDNLLLGPASHNGWTGLGALSATTVPSSPVTNYAFQTWTVGRTGRLAQVDLFGSVGSAYSQDGLIYNSFPLDFDVTLTILGGGTAFTPGDQVLGSVTKSAADIVSLGVTAFDFSALDIYATAGTTLAWRMSVEDCPVSYCVRGWSNWNNFTNAGGGTTNGYVGGNMILQSNGIFYYYNPQDLNFRTWVAVPEPAAWGLMILGLVGVGAALRRRGAMPA